MRILVAILAALASTAAPASVAQTNPADGMTRQEFDAGPAPQVAARVLGKIADLAVDARGYPIWLSPGPVLSEDLQVGRLILQPHFAFGVCERQILWIYFEGPGAGSALRIEDPRPRGAPPPPKPLQPQLPLDPPRRPYRIEITHQYAPLKGGGNRPPPGYATPVECEDSWLVAPDAPAAARALSFVAALGSIATPPPLIEDCTVDGVRCRDPRAAVASGVRGKIFEVKVDSASSGATFSLEGRGEDGRDWTLGVREDGGIKINYGAGVPLPDSFPGLLLPPAAQQK